MNQEIRSHTRVTSQDAALLSFLRGQPDQLYAFLSHFREQDLPPLVLNLRNRLEVDVVGNIVTDIMQNERSSETPASPDSAINLKSYRDRDRDPDTSHNPQHSRNPHTVNDETGIAYSHNDKSNRGTYRNTLMTGAADDNGDNNMDDVDSTMDQEDETADLYEMDYVREKDTEGLYDDGEEDSIEMQEEEKGVRNIEWRDHEPRDEEVDVATDKEDAEESMDEMGQGNDNKEEGNKAKWDGEDEDDEDEDDEDEDDEDIDEMMYEDNNNLGGAEGSRTSTTVHRSSSFEDEPMDELNNDEDEPMDELNNDEDEPMDERDDDEEESDDNMSLNGDNPIIVGPDGCRRNAKNRRERKRQVHELEKSRLENQNKKKSSQSKHSQQTITVENNGLPISEHQILQKNTREFLSTICSIARDSFVNQNGVAPSSDLHNLMRATVLKNVSETRKGFHSYAPGSVDSMVFIVQSYNDSEILESSLQLQQYLLAMHYAAQVQIIIRRNPDRLKASVHREVMTAANLGGNRTVGENQLRTIYSIGLKVAAMVSAGTPYILFILASGQLKTALKLLVASQVSAIHHLIRFPDESPHGVIIKDWLIPFLCQMRVRYPLSWDFLFEDYIGQLGIHQIPQTITDIIACDKIFDCYAFEIFRKERDMVAWADIVEPCDPASTFTVNHLIAIHHVASIAAMSIGQFIQKLYSHPDADVAHPTFSNIPPNIPEGLLTTIKWDKPAMHPDMIMVKTQYSPDKNKATTYRKEDPNHQRDLTEKQRFYASKAKKCDSVKQLRDKLGSQLKHGKRSRVDRYTEIDASVFDGNIIHISDTNGGLIAMVLANMPLHLRQNLMAILEHAFPNEIEPIDSTTLPYDYKFHAYHFSYYNRYASKGTGTPSDADPATIRKSGKHPVNTCQNIPRASEDFREDPNHVKQIMDCFSPILDWLRHQLQILLPDVFEILEVMVDTLPLGDTLPMYPFTGFVVNLNVTTLVHRDKGDEEICLVFQISEGTGGELCLMEPGLVIKLRSGDGVVFRSKDISHFNCHFQGKRASFVFHSDTSMKGWVLNRNDWAHNVNMCRLTNLQYD